MASSPFVWLVAFLILLGLLGLIVYQLMCLADLEYDYINPFDTAARINAVVVPEYVLQGLLTLLFLLTWHWAMVILCLPFVFFNFKLYQDRRHLVDVTEIFNHLDMEKKRRLVKILGLVVLIFLTLFWMIWSMLEDD